MRPTDGRIVDQLPLAQSYDAGGGVGGTRAIPAEEIPPAEKVTELAATAARLFDDRTAGLIYLPAFGGLRISECLALRRDDCFQQGPDGSWRIEIREPVHKSRRKTLPPKWRKRRWAFAPDWLTDDLDRLLADTDPGALLFASPGRPVRGPDGTVTRIGRGLYPYSNWRERTWEKLVAATPHCPGVQVWEVYVRIRPDLFGRRGITSRRRPESELAPTTGRRAEGPHGYRVRAYRGAARRRRGTGLAPRYGREVHT